jgi:hypothetical protein
MLATRKPSGIRLYAFVLGVVLLGMVVWLAVTLALEDRRRRRLDAEIDRASSELKSAGAQIASIKDAGLQSMNDYISAYAQIEPLQKEYDQKLQNMVELYRMAEERDSHKGFVLRWFYGEHHPKTWEQMSEIIAPVQQINSITKREISVVHAMTSLPEAERPRFWHEQFMPLAAEEHAWCEKLVVAGQNRNPDSKVQ